MSALLDFDFRDRNMRSLPDKQNRREGRRAALRDLRPRIGMFAGRFVRKAVVFLVKAPELLPTTLKDFPRLARNITR